MGIHKASTMSMLLNAQPPCLTVTTQLQLRIETTSSKSRPSLNAVERQVGKRASLWNTSGQAAL